MWERRAAQGSLGEGKPGGTTALISLGSDGPPLVPLGQNTPHTLSAARYESGLDNSPQCEPQQPRVSPSLSRPVVHADDGPLNGNEGFGLGPLTFNGSTHGVAGNGMMELYDVAFTSYHALDGRSLLEMSGAAGAAAGSDVVQKLRARVEATESELHRDLFDRSSGQYTNRLYNGTSYARWVSFDGLVVCAHKS